MAERKISADDLAAILFDSDSSESNFDDSVENMDWDPLLLSDERNYEDNEKDAAEDVEAIPTMDDSVIAAPDTNNSIEDEKLPSDDGDDSTIINNGN